MIESARQSSLLRAAAAAGYSTVWSEDGAPVAGANTASPAPTRLPRLMQRLRRTSLTLRSRTPR